MANKNDSSAPPTYPPYNPAQPYQQYGMHNVHPATPQARPQEVRYHETRGDNRLWRGNHEEEEEGGGQGEEEELPGSGPGGVPQKYLTLDFENFFKEDKNTTTFHPVYKTQKLMYRYIKLIAYHLCVLSFGFLLVPLWALFNGVIIFTLVWLWGPLLRITLVCMNAMAPVVAMLIHTILGPLFEVCGYTFRQIRVHANLSGGLGVNLSGARPLEQEQNV